MESIPQHWNLLPRTSGFNVPSDLTDHEIFSSKLWTIVFHGRDRNKGSFLKLWFLHFYHFDVISIYIQKNIFMLFDTLHTMTVWFYISYQPNYFHNFVKPKCSLSCFKQCSLCVIQILVAFKINNTVKPTHQFKNTWNLEWGGMGKLNKCIKVLTVKVLFLLYNKLYNFIAFNIVSKKRFVRVLHLLSFL